MNDNDSYIKEEANQLAQQFFKDDSKKCATFTDRLWSIHTKVKGKDFLLIHNPGGWGSTELGQLLKWEWSTVDGIRTTVKKLGYSELLIQYFRGGTSWWAHTRDLKKEACFFLTGKSFQAEVMATELNFIAKHHSNLRVILIGASQGAAFGNAVMRHLGDCCRVYSIELGILFSHMSRRVITDRTLVLDSNGTMPDPMSHRNLWVGFKVYITAPYRWAKYQLKGNPQKFTYCINAPGHDYGWEYTDVKQKITDFLTTNFGTMRKPNRGVS